MDGLSGTIPYCKAEEEQMQLTMDGWLGMETDSNLKNTQPKCRINDWRRESSVEFQMLNKGDRKMKFDFIIGNPPYQEEYKGSSSGANSVYDKFMDATFDIADRVELITPARFLFNAGSTPKAWNEKILHDDHFRVLHYAHDASTLFPNVIITGGVAITYHDKSKTFGPIEVFTAFEELNTILNKVKSTADFKTLSDIVVTSFAYHFTQQMHDDYPEAAGLMSKGHAFDLKSNCFDRLPQIFLTEKPSNDYVKILGRSGNERAYRFIRKDYINDVVNLHKYKLFFSKADGAAGTIGNPTPARIIGAATIGEPGTGSTETFLSVGQFETEEEVHNLLKYIKGKFARAMLGVLSRTR